MRQVYNSAHKYNDLRRIKGEDVLGTVVVVLVAVGFLFV
jgi:hypothetical protein